MAFDGNDPENSIDPFGLVIESSCKLDDYLNSIGITGFTSPSSGPPYDYGYSGVVPVGNASENLIVIKMLKAAKVYKLADDGGAVANLKKHVAARLTIVNNALNANFQFGPGQPLDLKGFTKDPQAFFDNINNGTTQIACRRLATIIMETGNKFSGLLEHDESDVWIPGDWGYIINEAQRKNPQNWPVGNEGENVFNVGTSSAGELFWGIFQSGITPPKPESYWFNDIRNNWRHTGNLPGDPQWQQQVLSPKIGLQ